MTYPEDHPGSWYTWLVQDQRFVDHVLAPPAASDTPLSATLRGFAHEVKNPLAGLRGAAQLLHRRVEDEQLRSLANLVIAEADRLAALANRLLRHDGAAPQLGDVNIHEQLERLGDLLMTGPTYTNVNDFRAIVVDSA